MSLHDVSTSLHATPSGLVMFREQEIPSSFLDDCRSLRIASSHMRERELHHVASVPAEVFDLWHVQGLRPYDMTPREIVAKLNADDLGAFVVTAKHL